MMRLRNDLKKYLSALFTILLVTSSVILLSPEVTDAILLGSIEGESASDNFGFAVSSAGDVNGDGVDDIIVGAPGYGNSTGRAYIFFGGPWMIDSLNANTANVTINGSYDGDKFGYCVDGGFDYNNDGYNDVIIGSPNSSLQNGTAYVFFGSSQMAAYIDAGVSNVTFTGSAAGNSFGFSVSSAGDINKDGHDDVIIGAPYHSIWWNKSWSYRMKLTFNNTGSSEDLINFPVLINLNASNFDYSKAEPNGEDIRFIDDDHVKELFFEIETWNSSYDSCIWVNVTKVKSGSDVDHIWMYYGNSLAVDGSDHADVWDEHYVGVWHLTEEKAGTGTPGLYNDSTSKNNDGYDNVTTPLSKGKINGCQRFNGNGDYISVPHNDSINLTQEMTISYWVQPTEDTSTRNRIVEKGIGGNQTAYSFGCGNGTNDLSFYLNNTALFDTANDVLEVDKWQHAAVNYNSLGDAVLFLNGEVTASGSYTGKIQGNSDDLYISYPNTLYDLPGYIDEVRISKTARGKSWLTAQYLSMNGSYVSYGSEETNETKKGAAFVFYGRKAMSNENISIESANVTLLGMNTDEKFGWDTADTGDVDNDNVPDIIVGAPGYGNDTGRAYIFYGRNLADGEVGNTDIILTGSKDNYQFGYAVSSAGNINGDGFCGVVVGAPGGSEAYIYYGGPGMGSGTSNVTLSSENSTEEFGYSVSSIGNVNNDGYNDLIIGAPGANSAYIFIGNRSIDPYLNTSSSAEAFYGSQNTSFGYSVAGGFNVIDQLFNQVIIGAPYEDSINKMGKAYIYSHNFTMEISYVKAYDNAMNETYRFNTGDDINFKVNISTTLISLVIDFCRITITAPNNTVLIDEADMALEQVDTNFPSQWKLFNYSFVMPSAIGKYSVMIKAISTLGTYDYELQYVTQGPGPPSEIIMSADQNTLVADGNSISNITFKIFDEDGNPIPGLGPDININLDDGAGDFGPITDFGNGTYKVTYTAPTDPEPDAVINISVGGIHNYTVIDLIKAPLQYIVIKPSAVDIRVGETYSFSAEGFDKYNNHVDISSTNWNTNVGTIESSSDTSSDFKAQLKTAKGVITASVGSISGSASITVIPGDLTRITISPASVDMVVDETRNYTAIGFDKYDNSLVLTNTQWTTNVGSIINSSNTTVELRAQSTVGTGYLKAEQGSLNGSANINIIPDILDKITVEPALIYISAGKQQVFTAVGVDKFGNTVTINPIWKTNVGIMEGANFTSQVQSGTGYVNATVGNITGSAVVNILADEPVRIKIVPEYMNLVVQESRRLVAVGYDKYDNIANILATWSTTIGEIYGNIFVAPTKIGSGYVYATFNGKKASAIINVTAGPLFKIIVTPENAEVVCGGSVEFTASGYDIFDNIVPVFPTWTSSVGSMSVNTLFAQTTIAEGYVTATHNNTIGSANVTVVPAELDHIIISPPFLEIKATYSHNFSAVGFDKYDNIVEIDPNWSSDVGQMNGNNFTAQSSPGQGIVTASVIENNTLKEISSSADVIVIVDELYYRPKIIGKIPDQIRHEDCSPWSLSLTPYESDDKDNGTNLKWYASGVDTLLFILSGEYSDNDTFKFIPVENAFGSCEISLLLIDSEGFIDHQVVWVNLTPVNDAPIIYGAPDIFVRYDQPYTFDYTPYVTDIDNNIEDLQITTIETTDTSFTSSDGLKVTYNYPRSMVGSSIFVTLEVSDGADSSTELIRVTITDKDVPILIKALPDVTLYEGSELKNVFDLDDYFSDEDGDSLFYTYGNQHVYVNINTDNTVDVSSLSDWYGYETVTFRAEDPIGALVEDTITITVLPVNDPPQLAELPDLFVHYDYDYKFDLTQYIQDNDNDTSELTVYTSDPSHIHFGAYNPLQMILNYPESMLGQKVSVTITVTDGIGYAYDFIKVQISDNFPPEIQKKIPKIEFYEDEKLLKYFDLDDFFFDNDGDDLFYSFSGTNIIVNINEDNSVDFNAPENWYGYETVAFRAEDPFGALAESIIKVTVIPVNDAPEISDIPDQSGKVGERWALDLSPYITDVDNNITDLTITADTDFIVINGLKLLFYSEQAKSIVVTIGAYDGDNNSTITFKLSFSDEKQTDDSMQNIYWAILIIILIILCCIAVLFIKYKRNFQIKEMYLFDKKGKLLANKRNEFQSLKKSRNQRDPKLLKIIRKFIKESDFLLHSDEEKNKLQIKNFMYNGYNVAIEYNNDVFLAVVYTGNGSKILRFGTWEILDDEQADYFRKFLNRKSNKDEHEDIDELVDSLIHFK
jgi:hypothetical protein